MCIPLEKVCNRKNDCGGWQDEPKGLCHINECSGGDSLDDLSRKRLKTGMRQEISKGHITIVGGGCDQQCIDLPIGFKCACDKGYELVGNTTCVGKPYLILYNSKFRPSSKKKLYWCYKDKHIALLTIFSDIDECQIPGSCSQICVNREGGFKCDCAEGYQKDPHDPTRCR